MVNQLTHSRLFAIGVPRQAGAALTSSFDSEGDFDSVEPERKHSGPLMPNH